MGKRKQQFVPYLDVIEGEEGTLAADTRSPDQEVEDRELSPDQEAKDKEFWKSILMMNVSARVNALSKRYGYPYKKPGRGTAKAFNRAINKYLKLQIVD